MKSADFKKIVAKELAPFLRDNEWKGTGFDYTRHVGSIVQAFTVQPSSFGGKFCIEIGVHFDFIPLKVEKKLSKMKTWDMDIRSRLTPIDGSDYWWIFPKNENESNILFNELKQLISSNGKDYFDQFDKWEEICENFTTEDIENGNTKSLFKIPPLRTALLLARMNYKIGSKEKAVELSNYGLSKIDGNKGSGLIPDFENIKEKSR